MARSQTLAERLRPASFRGVPFQVESTDLSAGRRTQLHEYPQRDKPYVEDLGRASRDLTFSGFVIGDDYSDQANALLGALEEAGPGTLVHPWFGTLQVSLKEPARVSFDAGLGQARFTMSFVEAGELEFPSAADATQAVSRFAASALESALVASFAEQFTIDGLPDFVSDLASGNLSDMLGIVSSSEIGKVLGLANSLADTVSTAIGWLASPSALGWTILNAFGLSGLATTVEAWGSIVRSLSRVGSSRLLADPASPVSYTPSRQQAYVNACAINALARQALIAQAVGASSLVGTKIDAKPISYNDMIAVRDDVIATIDSESLTAADSVYEALQAARLAVWKDLTVRARDNARLTTLTPTEVLPALVIAYDYYEDAARAADIVTRNGIRHPGFVPTDPLKVLTR